MNKKSKIFPYLLYIHIYILFFVISAGIVLLVVPVQAINMESTQYRIQFGTINTGGGKTSSASYRIESSLGQTAANQFQSTGYIVKAGFEYIHSIIPFAFSISKTNINLGELTPSVFSSDTTNLTVSFGGAGQYQVTTIAETPLQTQFSVTIPQATCDGTPSACTTTTARTWTNAANAGFGYNMTGQDIPADFTNSTYFRPFPVRSLAQNPAVVMTNTNVGKNRVSTMTFKTAISSLQAAGAYQTIINYVATPSY